MRFFVFALFLATAAAHAEETLVLPVGARHEAQLEQDEVLARCDNRASLRLDINHRGASFTAMRTGGGTVEFADEASKVTRRIPYQVMTDDAYRSYVAVRRLLQSVKGISVSAVDNHVVLEGKVTDAADLDRVRTVQAAYVDVVLNLAFNTRDLCQTYPCRHAAPEPPLAEVDTSFRAEPDWGANDPIVMAVRKATAQIHTQALPPDAQKAVDDYEKQLAAAMKKAKQRLTKLKPKYDQKEPWRAEAIAGEIRDIEALLGHYDRAPASQPPRDDVQIQDPRKGILDPLPPHGR